MKVILQFIFGGIIGFFVVYALMSFSEVRFSGGIAVISLITLSCILIVMSILRYQKIKSLNIQQFSGDEEDEIEVNKYKMFADYSLYANSSIVFSILALSLSLITAQQLILPIMSIVLIFLSYFLIMMMTYMMKQVYPDRNIDFRSQSVIDVADDGEKHVILDGLYKSHGLLNISLIAAIALSTVYSVTREDPQTFSIILMAMVLLVVNCKYLFVIRNK
ncbi:DUF3169 family protein [Metabacillus endolithicus]|uniref:DUF3169 family protein n=1 Tax=Metabacillus endolithicus TaxID=1535204 RepID=A0ABW5BUA8_9BACI|nr:DUF3169 family protein [Metabacillus endolithicus]UPG63604.1 DUF3169 domain-containing protein [Metabacillus endolithicus]